MFVHMTDYQMYRDDFGCPEIRAMWSEDGILQGWIDFEVVLADVQAELGFIPRAIADEIKAKGKLELVTAKKIADNFRVTNLASISMIRAFKDVCGGDAGEYIHYGATTQDILDTTLAYRIRKSLEIWENDLALIRDELFVLADKYRAALMPGVTHGQHAIPITFGFLCAMWAQSVKEHIERIREARPRICVGSVCGAAGNFASYHLLFGDKVWEMQEMVLKRFGLNTPPISIQPRNERLNEYLYLTANISTTFEKIADEIFLQQRNEIAQLEEPFDTEHQICSSTMPQKRNPVRCENIKAYATMLRSMAGAFSELHMRDLRDDSAFFVEDFNFPTTAILMDSMLKTAHFVIAGLTVKPQTMRRNLDISGGLIMSEPLALILAQKTGQKDTAMKIVHKAAMESFEKGIPYEEYALSLPELREYMSEKEIRDALNPANYLGLNDRLIDNVIESR